MLIQKNIKKNKNRFKLTLSNIFLKYYFFLSISLFLILVFLVLQTGYWGNYKKTFLDRFYKSSYNNYLKLPYIIPQAIYGYFLKIPQININISFDNQLILEKDRKTVLRDSNGFNYLFSKVPASIDYESKNLEIDVRLKGDRNIHFIESSKASYKIEIENDKTIFGLNKFSLIKPRARNYIHEWLYHEFMEEGDLIKLKYDFVKLKINGESNGLYVIEEGFDKILIERNKRRNGPIFSVNEEWTTGFNNQKKDILFEVYNKRTWLSDKNKKFTLFANNLLKNFFNGNENIENLFDIDKWAWFMAVSDINYYAHGVDVRNVKFYFNPVNAKFEPIPFDGHRVVVDLNKNIIGWKNYQNSAPSFERAFLCHRDINNCKDLFHYKFFFNKDGKLNKTFFDKYKKNINLISSKKFLENFFDSRSEKISKINAKIYGDYFYADNIQYFGPGLYYFNKEEIFKRANRLKAKISVDPSDIFISQAKNRIDIKNWNITSNAMLTNHNLYVKKIFCYDASKKREIIYDINQIIDKNNQHIILEENTMNNINCNRALLFDRISNVNFLKEIDHLNFQHNSEKKIKIGNFLDYFNVNNGTLRLKNKKVIIDKNIIIPKGYVIKIISGEEIVLTDNSFIISESKFNVDGGDPANNPSIIIRGNNENMGGGLFIKNVEDENFFRNVIFENLNGNLNEPLLNKYYLYGAINIYNSKIKLNNFHFKNIFSEDAINIISSDFLLENGVFNEISSDAIDIDYGKGIVNNLEMKNILNDAIDFSESNANISNIFFGNIGDKAISAGENSKIEIDNLKISDSYLGITSKDGSDVNAKNIKISSVTIPFASYKKKNEYNEPQLKIKKIDYNGYKKLYLKDKFAKIIIDNKKKKKITKNILDIIYNPSHKIY